MARTAALALVLLAFMAGAAQATTFTVIAAPGLRLEDMRTYEATGAVGLLVPGAGPETSEALARAALVRGAVESSLRGGVPGGPPLISTIPGGAAPPPGPTIVVGLPQGGRQANDRRYPVAVVGAGFRGVLVSPSTRVTGIVSIADIAPTALGRAGSLSSEPRTDAVDRLLALDRRIDRNNSTRTLAMLALAALLVVLALLFPRGALLAFGTVLLVNLALGVTGVSEPWLVVFALVLAAVAAGPLTALVLRSPVAIGVALGIVVLAHLAVLGVDGEAVSLSPLGPTQNSRFFGLSNLLETLLLVPALAGAALLAVPFGWSGFLAVALVTLVAVAGDRFGADGGGAVVLGAGFFLLAVLLAAARRAAAVAALLVAGGAVLAFLALDAAAGGSSHVSRALESGPGGLAGDLADRVGISWERATAHWYIALLVAATIAVVAVRAVLLARRGDLPIQRRALPLAFAAALATSFVVNDSPNDVAATGLAAFLAVEAVMLRDPCARFFSPSRSPLSFAWPAVAARGQSRPRPRP